MFQPTRPRGARLLRCSGRLWWQSFNPRAHEGRDYRRKLGFVLNRVSTHAPTRGATLVSIWPTLTFQFQPTRPRGARRLGLFRCLAYVLVSTHAPTRGATGVHQAIRQRVGFQPTRPRGARLFSPYTSTGPMEFQPTRPRGARRGVPAASSVTPVSTHAPTRGATRR